MILDFMMVILSFIIVIAFIVGLPMTFGIGSLLVTGFLCTSIKTII